MCPGPEPWLGLLCTAPEEQVDVRDMLERREAENALKRTTIAPQTSTGVKHDWTHHFKAVRERPAAFRAAMAAEPKAKEAAAPPTSKPSPTKAPAMKPAAAAAPIRQQPQRPDARRFMPDPLFDAIGEDLPPVRTGRAPSASVSGSGMPGHTTSLTSPSCTDTFGTRRGSYGMHASPGRGGPCDAYGFPIHGLAHSSSIPGGMPEFSSDYDLLRDNHHSSRGLPHAHSLGHLGMGSLQSQGPYGSSSAANQPNPFDTGLLHGPSSSSMCNHSMLPYDASEHSMLTCGGLPVASGPPRGSGMRGHHLSMPQVLTVAAVLSIPRLHCHGTARHRLPPADALHGRRAAERADPDSSCW